MAKPGAIPAGYVSVGDNVYFKQDNGSLFLAIDAAQKGIKSASGKSLVVASTRGNVNIAGAGKLGLNLYRAA